VEGIILPDLVGVSIHLHVLLGALVGFAVLEVYTPAVGVITGLFAAFEQSHAFFHAFVIGGPHLNRVSGIGGPALPEIDDEIFHHGGIFFQGLVDGSFFVNAVGNRPEAFHKHFEGVGIVAVAEIFGDGLLFVGFGQGHDVNVAVEPAEVVFGFEVLDVLFVFDADNEVIIAGTEFADVDFGQERVDAGGGLFFEGAVIVEPAEVFAVFEVIKINERLVFAQHGVGVVGFEIKGELVGGFGKIVNGVWHHVEATFCEGAWDLAFAVTFEGLDAGALDEGGRISEVKVAADDGGFFAGVVIVGDGQFEAVFAIGQLVALVVDEDGRCGAVVKEGTIHIVFAGFYDGGVFKHCEEDVD